MTQTGLSSLVVPGVPWHTQILADQLTLFQPGGGQIMPTYLLLVYPDFQTFQRPWMLILGDKQVRFYLIFDQIKIWTP